MQKYIEIYWLQDSNEIYCKKQTKTVFATHIITHTTFHWKIPIHFLINLQTLFTMHIILKSMALLITIISNIMLVRTLFITTFHLFNKK